MVHCLLAAAHHFDTVLIINSILSHCMHRIEMAVPAGGRPRRRPPQATRIKHGVLPVHKDYKGLLPVCYFDTGLQEGGPHDGYACFENRDMLLARRVTRRFHIEQKGNV